VLKNYFLTAIRNIKRHKLFSVINIIGLTVGMVSSILILFYVLNEISFDKFNTKQKDIYRVITGKKTAGGNINDAVNPPALAPALMSDFPEISGAVRFLNIDNPTPLVVFGEKRFYEKRFYFVDQNIFDLFTIRFVEGEPHSALKDPNSVVITETAAVKYFGSISPVGKVLRFNNQLVLNVTGVIKNIPVNSTIKGDFFVSFSTLNSWLGQSFVDNWQNNMCETYVLLKEDVSASALEVRMASFVDKHIDKANSIKRILLQPLSRIHLYSKSDYNISSDEDITYIYSLTAIALFILFIACFNYLNLRVSQMQRRFKEVGIRKAVGATTGQLVTQLFFEGVLYTTLAFLLALLIIPFTFPYINEFTGLSGITENTALLIWPALFALLVGLLFGSYPVFFLRTVKMVKKDKTRIKFGRTELTTGKILVITQFALTNFLIIGSLVIFNQLNYIQNKKLGFDGEQVVIVPIREQNLRQDQTILKNILQQTAGIREIGASALLPGGPVGKTKFQINGRSEQGTMAMLWVDHNFIKTLGIQIAAGRSFSTQYSTDAAEAFVLNEEAVNKLGFASPDEALNKPFEINGGKKGTIIGVVKDFHFASMQNKIEPLVMHIWPWLNYLLVRFDPAQASVVVNNIKTAMNKVEPGNPFEYKFLNDNFNKYYIKENRLKEASSFFTGIALLLTGFGLFSLAANALERKTKEITIRKVLGATVTSIFYEQMREFALLVLAALIIAFPVAYYFMTGWLSNYAYHAGIEAGVFVATLLISFIVLFFMVGYHAYKAAKTNPVDGLRYE
jgi:putative ABC transport system permease protein